MMHPLPGDASNQANLSLQGALTPVQRSSDTNPLDNLLRARLRIPEGKNFQLAALRGALELVDACTRLTTRQPFFALRETEDILRQLDGRTGLELIDAVLAMNGGTEITAHGLDNVPATGRVVIASTHPIGTFDFLAHAGALLDHRPDLKVVAGRETERFLGRERLIAVDLDGKDKVTSPRRTIEGMIAHLEDEGAVLIFGSGRVPRMENGWLVEPPWRTGVTRTSAKTGAPIVPASADMKNSRHYYRTRRIMTVLSGGNEEFGRRVASLRYVSELIAKLGGSYDVYYGPIVAPGTSPEALKPLAETLVPGLYQT